MLLQGLAALRREGLGHVLVLHSPGRAGCDRLAQLAPGGWVAGLCGVMGWGPVHWVRGAECGLWWFCVITRGWLRMECLLGRG